MKKLVSKLKRGPWLAIPVVLVLGLVVGGYFLFSGGGEDAVEDPKGDVSKGRVGKVKKTVAPAKRGRRVKPAPVVVTGTLDEARREGRLVVAQARGTVRKPRRIRLRVSSAPKQRVTVFWQLGCYRNRVAKLGRGDYKVRTPNVRQIRLPLQGAESCIVTANAQLTRDRPGRIKITVVSG